MYVLRVHVHVCEPISLVSTGVFVEVQISDNVRVEVVEGNETELCMNVFTSGIRFEREVNVTFDLIPISTFGGNQI